MAFTCPRCQASIADTALRFDLDLPREDKGLPATVVRCHSCIAVSQLLEVRRMRGWGMVVLAALLLVTMARPLSGLRGHWSTVAEVAMLVGLLMLFGWTSQRATVLRPVPDTDTGPVDAG